MDRYASIRSLEERVSWDLVVIGGGATGLGVALDAATRGYRTLLLERRDFAQGTSSRSTKLIHGGVRYLEQGRLTWVRESLRERSLLLKNAPDVVRPIRFLVPAYSRWDRARVRLGLRLYDSLASGVGGTPASEGIDAHGAKAIWPDLPESGLRGGTTYTDAQFDDARMAIVLARAIHDHGSVALNHIEVVEFTRDASGRIVGVVAVDRDPGRDSGRAHEISAKVVVDATGVFSEATRRLAFPGDGVSRGVELALSRGTHLVLGSEFVKSDHALLIPRTEDGRVLFAIPWQRSLLVGTTDVPVSTASEEPAATVGEIEYLLRHVRPYLTPAPALEDVRSAWAGIRPLVAQNPGAATSRLSREHVTSEPVPGLVSVVGGKWTTYRAMAEEVVDRAAVAGSLSERRSRTDALRLTDVSGPAGPVLEKPREELPITDPLRLEAFVRHSVRHEMARCALDVLARRTRTLFLDARLVGELAQPVAVAMARELGRAEAWVETQVRETIGISERYLPGGIPTQEKDEGPRFGR